MNPQQALTVARLNALPTLSDINVIHLAVKGGGTSANICSFVSVSFSLVSYLFYLLAFQKNKHCRKIALWFYDAPHGIDQRLKEAVDEMFKTWGADQHKPDVNFNAP